MRMRSVMPFGRGESMTLRDKIQDVSGWIIAIGLAFPYTVLAIGYDSYNAYKRKHKRV